MILLVTARVARGVMLAVVALSLAGICRAGSNESQLLSSLAPPVINNPSFEANALSFTTFPGYVGGANPATITGWSSTGGYGINGTGPGMSTPFSAGSPIPDGVAVAFLQVSSPGAPVRTLSQLISGFEGGAGYDVGGTYQLGFRYNARNGGTPDLNVTISDGVNPPIVLFSQANIPHTTGPYYTAVTTPFVATAPSMTLSFNALASGPDESVLLDSVSLVQLSAGVAALTPEPSSFALFGLAAAGLGGWLWRRRRTAC